MASLLALALAVCLLQLAPGAHSVAVPLGYSGAFDAAALRASCVGQGDRRMCNPLPTGGRNYIQCGAEPAIRTCPTGFLFDYVFRRCVHEVHAQPCPNWYCPAVPSGPALGTPFGTFGQRGNLTIQLRKKEMFTLVCPVHGHCLGGMVFNVRVECPAPLDRAPYTFVVEFTETLTNDMIYPKRLADIEGYCGDRVYVQWNQPTHVIQLFNTSSQARRQWQGTPITPFPPQPVYQCPTWPTAPPQGFPVPQPGDQVIMPVAPGAQNATWTANVTETFFFVCPLSNHCRLGQVFRVTVTARPANAAAPTVHRIMWTLTSDNFEDMSLFVGDSIIFQVPPGPPQAHGLFKVPANRIMTLA